MLTNTMATDATVSTVSNEKNVRSPSSSESSEKSPGSSLTIKSLSGGVDSKLCGVCGDKALGNNFNAITCESCKAFFRRNALRSKEFVCPFSNNCKVNAVTRRFCQRCRLKKCFDIGMKKEWIMTDEEKKIKKQKIEQNRKKRTSLENSGGTREASPDIDDEDADDLVSIPNKYDPESPDSEMLQRLTGPVVAAVTSGIATYGGASRLIEDDRSNVANTKDFVSLDRPSKVQPMGLHNRALTSDQRNGNSVMFQKDDRERNNRETGVPISSPCPSQTTASPPLSPRTISLNQQNHSITSDADPSQNGYSHSNGICQQNNTNMYYQRAPQNSHPQQVQTSVPPSWIEGDSSNSTPSPISVSSTHAYSQPQHQEPPPLIKYPPNKRPRMYDQSDDHAEHQTVSNNQSNSLLSFLIQPNNSESSPDYASSPPASHPVQSVRNQADYVEDDGHNQLNSPSYVLSNQTTRHQTLYNPQYREYQDDYDRPPPTPQSPPLVPAYQNGYHNNSRYPHQASYQAAVDLDNHSHDQDHNHYSDNQLRQEQNQSMRSPPIHTMDSILSIAIAAEFNSFGMLGGSIPNSKVLNKAEQAKLNELLIASQALHAPVDAERPIPKDSASSDTSLLNVINLTEIAIRRLIKMSKRISGFKNMCQEDQIALLKGGCTEMMILRSAVTYDPDRDSWQIPHSNPGYNINLGVLKEARGNLYEEHQRFNKTFRSEWRKDENIMIILCAITLFTPERPNVIHKDVVKLEQDSYYYLLKRYLESVLNGCEAKSNYLQLIRKIAELRALNSSHVRVFLEMNPKEVEPLLIEIFDLK